VNNTKPSKQNRRQQSGLRFFIGLQESNALYAVKKPACAQVPVCCAELRRDSPFIAMALSTIAQRLYGAFAAS
jgi:hypothetical protein